MIIWGIVTVISIVSIQWIITRVKKGGKLHWFFSSKEAQVEAQQTDLKLRQVKHVTKSLQITTGLIVVVYLFFWTIGRFDYIGMAFVPTLVIGFLYAITAMPTEAPQE